ncbi:MAG: protein TolR [Gammaproteobacteria bacterium]|nr:protein TolR [Gammaproteobacteria bacterium]
MASASTRRRKYMSEINVVPYVDVTLVLLVIFMITAPLFHEGVEVELPAAPAKQLEKIEKNQDPVVVSVDRLGQIFVNRSDSPKRPVADESFRNQIRKMLSDKPDELVYVRGDRNVDYGRVVSVMVMLQDAGAENVGLITDPAAEKTDP